MSSHISNLKQRCRYGNCSIDIKEIYSQKLSYLEEFMELFFINICNGAIHIHLDSICNKHRTLLSREKSPSKTGNTYCTSDSPFQFSEHFLNCPVCTLPHTISSECHLKKRSSAGPGIGLDSSGEPKRSIICLYVS